MFWREYKVLEFTGSLVHELDHGLHEFDKDFADGELYVVLKELQTGMGF